MSFQSLISQIIDHMMLYSCVIIMVASIILSIKSRFVQFRLLPHMIKSLTSLISLRKKTKEDDNLILAHKALFTAMSTTIGISTIVGPIVAMHFGGPGALLGFLVTTIFGTAANFTEVTLALSYRKRLDDGRIMGGPMQYLQDDISPFIAKWYALFGLCLMIAWSSAQSNQLAAVLNSDLLGSYKISVYITGAFLALCIPYILFRGIKAIGNISAKLVPLMFVVYVGGALWIIGANIQLMPSVFVTIFDSAFSPKALASGAVVGGIANAIRWGVFKGLQSNEAGIGTQTIPHSLAQTDLPIHQGILSMVSTYSAGFISLLSGCVALLTGTWNDHTIPLGINMVAKSFQMHFSYFGILIVTVSTILFAFGTILGNSFNGSQCFSFLTKNKFLKHYYLLTAVLVFFGAISDVTFIWTVTDFFLAPLAVPHIVSLLILAFKKRDLLTA